MAIFYSFTINDPNGAGSWPPSVASSTWLSNLNNYLDNHTCPPLPDGSMFANRAQLDAFLAEHTLTDAGLLADIASWKSAHNVSYSNKFYYTIDSIPSDGLNPTGIIT